jgi:hypothetical protein
MMHEQNSLSTRCGLLQAADCLCPRRCASALGRAVFNHFQGWANSVDIAMRAHVVGCLLGNGLGMGCQNTLRVIGCKSPVVDTKPSTVQHYYLSVQQMYAKHISRTLMESGGSFAYASCGGGFIQTATSVCDIHSVAVSEISLSKLESTLCSG